MTAFAELFKRAFEEVEALDLSWVASLNDAAAVFREQLLSQMASGDPKLKIAAEESVAELQSLLDIQIKKIARLSGLDPQELLALGEEQANQLGI